MALTGIPLCSSGMISGETKILNPGDPTYVEYPGRGQSGSLDGPFIQFEAEGNALCPESPDAFSDTTGNPLKAGLETIICRTWVI
jgi:hypothetical protein